MPTGIEEAAIILAVFPLVISALEHYAEGLQPVFAAVYYRSRLKSFIRKLRTEQSHYLQALELLLKPITTARQLKAMIADPTGPEWSRPDFQKKLESRLKSVASTYSDIVIQVNELLSDIIKSLQIEHDGSMRCYTGFDDLLKDNPPDGNKKYNFKQRVWFGGRLRKRDKKLNEIHRLIEDMDRFEGRNSKLETYKSITEVDFDQLLHLEKHAKTLHKVLAAVWICACRSEHKARLQLDMRLPVASDTTRDVACPCFRLFCFVKEVVEHNNSWFWQEVEIQFQPEPPPHPTSTEGCQAPVGPGQAPVDAHPDAAQNSQTNFGQLKYVDNMCKAIAEQLGARTEPGVAKPCQRFYITFDTRLQGVYSVQPGHSKTPEETVSLQQLYAMQERTLQHNFPPLGQRAIFAVVLVSSFYQYYSTPWWKDSWEKADIVFTRTVSGLPDMKKPFLVEESVVPEDWWSEEQRTKTNNISTLILGINLLELYTGEPFPQTKPDIGAASDWLNRKGGDIPDAWRSAIQYCLSKSLYGPPFEERDLMNFRQEFLYTVVRPLYDYAQTSFANYLSLR